MIGLSIHLFITIIHQLTFRMTAPNNSHLFDCLFIRNSLIADPLFTNEIYGLLSNAES